jgi:hypothetical protein
MASIEIILRDDHGNIIKDGGKRVYELNLCNKRFSELRFTEIERSVEEFKKNALPDISADLLKEAQNDYKKEIKKKEGLKCNGTTPVHIKSLNGYFPFRVQRFLSEAGEVTYFDLTEQFKEGYVSDVLREFSGYYSNRLSYKEVEELIERVTGKRELSDGKIQEIVVNKAIEVSKVQEEEELEECQELKMPKVQGEVNIYDVEEKEILLFDDGIQVKKQKANREKKGQRKLEEPFDNKRGKVNTDVVMLEKKDGDFEYIIGGIDEEGKERVPFEDIVKSEIIKEYGQEKGPLKIVAITDGAKDIRTRLLAIFGIVVTIILDWYHLCKKVRELMSMIACNKEEKITHMRELFYYLWRGMANEAIEYLKQEVTARHKQKLRELITYLEKHKAEIIDYRSRQKAGKTIGSGRMEKGVDQVIGYRQKKKGMSWSKKGSKSLGILKVAELNNRWKEIWFSEDAAINSEDYNSSHLPLAANY